MKKLLVALFLFSSLSVFAQKDKSPFEKFGKVTKEHLDKKVYDIDPEANAVILSKFGQTLFEGNSDGWFSTKTTIHVVTHILNENGYSEADVSVRLFVPEPNSEVITTFKGATYNLENGKVAVSKIGKSNLIREKVDKERALVKFTMPNVKKGSIIEYEYEIVSVFISQPDPWYFQSTTAPTLWSEYIFGPPEFFSYRLNSRTYFGFDVRDANTVMNQFTVRDNKGSGSSDVITFRAAVALNRWVIKDLPQLKSEPFIKSLKNNIASMELQLIAQSHPLATKSYRSTWQEITKNMLESQYFGKNLEANNNWLKDEMKGILNDSDDLVEKARKIYYYVRDQFTATSEYGLFMDNNLRNVFKAKKGNVAELNILLTAMLRYAGINAAPVMLSTTENGYINDIAPMTTGMNYIICYASIGSKGYYLDASQSKLGFNKLPTNCYNGSAVMVDGDATRIQLPSDSIIEKSRSFFIFINSDDGYIGTAKKNLGYYSSLSLRDEFNEQNLDELKDRTDKKYGDAYSISSFKVDSFDRFEVPVVLNYQLKMNFDDENILYVNPYFGENQSKNPFVSATRNYPVELPYQIEDMVIATIDIPDGYEMDEIPKSIKVTLDPEGSNFFEYRIGMVGKSLSFRSLLKIDRTYFDPEEYENLREFFNYVVKKQAEQIVFKKIKS